MIRKTSLLRKIEPVMRRSSFTNKDAAHPGPSCDAKALIVPEIVYVMPRIASQTPYPDRSPLYDVRNPAPKSLKDNRREVMFSRTNNARPAISASQALGDQTIWWSQTGSNRR